MNYVWQVDVMIWLGEDWLVLFCVIIWQILLKMDKNDRLWHRPLKYMFKVFRSTSTKFSTQPFKYNNVHLKSCWIKNWMCVPSNTLSRDADLHSNTELSCIWDKHASQCEISHCRDFHFRHWETMKRRSWLSTDNTVMQQAKKTQGETAGLRRHRTQTTGLIWGSLQQRWTLTL